MGLSKKQLNDVCLLYQNGQCRYLEQDANDWNCWHCLKKRPIEKQKIDKKVSEFIKDEQSKGHDPYKQNAPLGDNCQGYPLLRHIEQGYDKSP